MTTTRSSSNPAPSACFVVHPSHRIVTSAKIFDECVWGKKEKRAINEIVTGGASSSSSSTCILQGSALARAGKGAFCGWRMPRTWNARWEASAFLLPTPVRPPPRGEGALKRTAWQCAIILEREFTSQVCFFFATSLRTAVQLLSRLTLTACVAPRRRTLYCGNTR